MRTLIITCMRNEAPFVLEWVAYHRSIGFTDFLVFTNDCDDGTDRLLDGLAEAGYVQHLDNPWKRMKNRINPQKGALRYAEDLPIVADVDRILVSDVDEFVNIHVADGSLDALFKVLDPDTDAIAMQWRLFGNADVDRFRDRWITEQFDMCAPELCTSPIQAWAVKTLFRTDGPGLAGKYSRFGVHRPVNPIKSVRDQIKFLNGSGDPVLDKFIDQGWRFGTGNYGYGLVTLNHYAVRSAESFLVKRARGRVNHTQRDQDLAYWLRMNFNMERDRSIQPKLDRAKAELDAMLTRHPKLADLHAAGVAAHRDKIEQLKSVEVEQAFHSEITGDRLRKISRHLNLLKRKHFSDGPQSIPSSVWTRIERVVPI